MGGFKRAFLGYRRAEVDAAMAMGGARIAELERELPRIGELQQALAAREGELGELSSMVIERERDNRELRQELALARERHDRSLASLEAITERLEEVQAQARGQATRIRMKALREAVEVSRRVQELATPANGNGAEAAEALVAPVIPALPDVAPAVEAPPAVAPAATATAEPGMFAGDVKVDIGPLSDFSQLVGFEDAAAQIRSISGIAVERFSAGRATLALHIEDPIDLAEELKQRCSLGLEVRFTASDHLVLDVDPAAARRAA